MKENGRQVSSEKLSKNHLCACFEDGVPFSRRSLMACSMIASSSLCSGLKCSSGEWLNSEETRGFWSKVLRKERCWFHICLTKKVESVRFSHRELQGSSLPPLYLKRKTAKGFIKDITSFFYIYLCNYECLF